jgi:ankyrin repeat protein
MHLVDLPTELVLCIAENLDRARDILALARTNRRTPQIALQVLYRFNVRYQNSSALHWAAERGVAKLVHTFLCLCPEAVNAVHENITPLISAAIHGSESIVEILLRARASVNFYDNTGRTALWYAAFKGHARIVNRLLAREHIEVDCRGTLCGLTPLAAAAWNGYEQITESLIATGQVNINTREMQGLTPLFLAIVFQHEEIVKILLCEETIEIECRDRKGRTPLHYAASRGQLSIARMLLQKGADANAADNTEETPLDKAIVGGHEIMVKAILERSNRVSLSVDSEQSQGQAKSLFLATARGYSGIIQLLLDHGFNANVRNHYDRAPLHLAARDGDLGGVKVLLGHQDIDVNAQDRYGATALHLAAKEGHTAILKELVAMPEADINRRDRSGATALWLATRRGHDDLAIQLLSQPDVDVNAIVHLHVLGRDRSTSLHHAVQRPSMPVLKSLVWTRQLDPKPHRSPESDSTQLGS